MPHFQKFKMTETVHLLPHYERKSTITSYSNSSINTALSKYNYNLAPERENQVSYVREQLLKIHHVKRKDLVVMCDWIITQPKDLDPNLSREFFQHAYDFCVERYGTMSGMGEDCIISCYVHLDETTPHMHLAFLPVLKYMKTEKITKNGISIEEKTDAQKFCAKEIATRVELKLFQQDLQKYMDKQGLKCSILNGNTHYDSNGRALSVKELKMEKHLDIERSLQWETEWDIEY